MTSTPVFWQELQIFIVNHSFDSQVNSLANGVTLQYILHQLLHLHVYTLTLQANNVTNWFSCNFSISTRNVLHSQVQPVKLVSLREAL